jgi:molybdenum cofactor synthesis domain-containing protein
MARIASVNVSKVRRTAKRPVESAEAVEGAGLAGDGHSGPGDRQLSLLSTMSMELMEARGVRGVEYGCCGENLDIRGMELHTLLPGAELALGDEVRVLVTGIGKDNSDGHADNVIEGNIFPEQGAFARVVRGGPVEPGMEVAVRADGLRAGVLTASDSVSRGEREDASGPLLLSLLREAGYATIRYAASADDPEALRRRLCLWCDDASLDLLLTTGGTGLSPRDNTPEATEAVTGRRVPGIPEMLRAMSAEKVRTAWLSRGTAGIRRRTLIVNLPGSRRAVEECLGFLLPLLGHALEVLRGDVSRCGG